jgi:hypothetical protein
VRCGAHQRKVLEYLCRYITRPAIANERPLAVAEDGADLTADDPNTLSVVEEPDCEQRINRRSAAVER